MPSFHSLFAALFIIALSFQAACEEASRNTDRKPRPAASETRDDNVLKCKFIWCPPGSFTMGYNPTEFDPDPDLKRVPVTLTNGFWLGQSEVTQMQWRQLMNTSPWEGKSYARSGDNLPATYVSYNDALLFCEKLTEQERAAGRLTIAEKCTLPTSAQWEYACRAGAETRYPFGDVGKPTSVPPVVDEKHPHLIGQMAPNPWGFHDMHGNVWEWTTDGFADQPVGGQDPTVPPSDFNRVIRGGSWLFQYIDCPSGLRHWESLDSKTGHVGFRIARIPVTSKN
ncbi:MAG: formylglycine-generating enzyme family protein [Planctomycetaceae bacterium]|nr:formylglycine-generating enzyme family protein [Planctomycetaceae bacterium]